MTPHKLKWLNYRDSRRGSYEYRCATRYKGVADRLFKLGLNDRHTIRDIGAGTCQFGQYLKERGWCGCYLPMDAVIDGIDLEDCAIRPADFIVCIEVLEHLRDPWWMLDRMWCAARRAVVLTTPNPETVDVLACDPTHVSVIQPRALTDFFNMKVERHSWFGGCSDTLLAWRSKPQLPRWVDSFFRPYPEVAKCQC